MTSFLRGALLALLPALPAVGLGPHAGQGQVTPTEDVEPSPVPQASKLGLDRAAIAERIAALELGGEGDDEARARLLRTYKDLLQWLDTEAAHLERAEAFRTSIAQSPIERDRIRTQLAADKAAPPEPLALPESASAADVQQLLTEAQAELARVRARHAELTQRTAGEDGRPAQIPAEETAARTALSDLETQLSEPEPGPEASEAERVARGLLLARRRARTAELRKLEQELLSNRVRVEVLAAQRDAAASRASRLEERTRALEAAISELRQREAERAKAEAARLERQARAKHPLIQEVAKEIAELSNEANEILPRIDGLRAERDRVETQLAQTRADLDQTNRSLELGITQALGTVLLELRRNLPDSRSFRRSAAERSAQASRARLRLFGLEREQSGLASELSRRIAATETAEGVDPEALRQEVARHLETKREGLERLENALRDFLRAIGNVESLERHLIEVADELGAILDERLLWIPNARPFGPESLRQLPEELGSLLSPELWGEAFGVLRSDFQRRTWRYVLVFCVLTGLTVSRRRSRARIDAVSKRVGRVREDGISLTLQAIALHTVNRLPIPAAFTYVGWRLSAAQETTDVAKAVGTGIVAAAATGFLLELLKSLCRREGVAQSHFGWTERTGKVVRRHVLWFQAFAIPLVFCVAATKNHPDAYLQLGIGRAAFIVSMAASAVFFAKLFDPARGIVVGHTLDTSWHWLRRSRPLWRPLGVLIPITLAVMAIAGYDYAARQLELRLIQTLLVIFSAIFIHAFCLRWLTISQRRLALKVALERRAALAAARKAESGELEEVAESPLEALEEIDVAEIGGQTQDLLRTSIGLYIAIASWFAWVGVLPALGILDGIPLWDHEVIVDGVAQQAPITLANVGLALLALVVTATAARNMPGFLEITVLQRLPLEQGVRYATRTLVLYSIVTTGILVAFNVIGVGWSSVQWLVAALTVGLGFGLQEIFANFVSGLIILLERPVRVGDTVTVADVSGVVTRIRMRATTITDWHRRELVVPNKSFITGELVNWSLSDPILRLDFPVGIAYGSDTTLAHKTMLKVCTEHPLVLQQPEPNVFFTGFGDNSLNFDVRVFVSEQTNTSRSRILHDLHMAIDQACREHDITIAFPQRDLHFKSSEEALRVRIEK